MSACVNPLQTLCYGIPKEHFYYKRIGLSMIVNKNNMKRNGFSTIAEQIIVKRNVFHHH